MNTETPDNISLNDLNATGTDNQAAIEITPAAKSKRVIKLEPPVSKDGYTLEQVAVEKPETPTDGLKFWSIKWTGYAQMLAKYGEAGVLAIVNSQLRFALRGKAKAQLPSEETPAKTDEALAIFFQKESNFVLLSQEDAESYIPGKRETTSSMSFFRQAAIAKKESRFEDAKELTLKGMTAMMAEQGITPDDLTELEESGAVQG